MGAGFAIFVKAEDAERTAQVARDCGVQAWVAGTVEAGEKQLLIEPLWTSASAKTIWALR